MSDLDETARRPGGLLTDGDIARLTAAMVAALRDARRIPEEKHHDQHLWLEVQILKDRAWAEFWKEQRSHIAKWGIFSVFALIFIVLPLAFLLWNKQLVRP